MSDSPSLFSDDTQPTLATDFQGLELSDIHYQDPYCLTDNPLNSTFDKLKDQLYLDALQADIAKHGIVNALIATKNGLLIEGHSRLLVAKNLNLPQVPVRFILTELSDQELKERLYLGNLHRFEISKDARTKMFADLYPHIFYDPQSSIPENLAKIMGLSLSQVRNEKQLLLLAIELKEAAHDTSALTLEDIAKARSKTNQARRERERLKRMQWQNVEEFPLKPFAQTPAMPLFLSHEEAPSPQELDIHQEYKLLSQGDRQYNIYTKNDQLIASLDPHTFLDIEELDTFAKDLILRFHQLRQDRAKDPHSPS